MLRSPGVASGQRVNAFVTHACGCKFNDLDWLCAKFVTNVRRDSECSEKRDR